MNALTCAKVWSCHKFTNLANKWMVRSWHKLFVNIYVADQLPTSGYLQQRKEAGLEILQGTLPHDCPIVCQCQTQSQLHSCALGPQRGSTPQLRELHAHNWPLPCTSRSHPGHSGAYCPWITQPQRRESVLRPNTPAHAKLTLEEWRIYM